MTTTTTSTTTSEYLPDRYDRLKNATEILASDPDVENADAVVSGVALRAFVETLADEHVLDGLTDYDADTVALLVSLDFLRGPEVMVERIGAWLNDWLNDRPICGRSKTTNSWGVGAALAQALYLYLAAFAGPEFTDSRSAERRAAE